MQGWEQRPNFAAILTKNKNKMKKVLLLLLMVLPLAFSSCSKDDDNEKTFSISEKEITFSKDDTKQIKSTEDANWSVENRFIASVSNSGLVTANHVGKTIVKAKGNNGTATCVVNVIPKYTYFQEPYLKFGATETEIKNLEKRIFQEKRQNVLIFKGENKYVTSVFYSFENGKMKSAGIIIPFKYIDIAPNYYGERYQYMEKKGEDIIMINGYDKEHFDTMVMLSANKNGAFISYHAK